MFSVIVELADFLFKAVVAYAKTPEGQVEFSQIYDAAEKAYRESGEATGLADVLGLNSDDRSQGLSGSTRFGAPPKK